MDDDHSRPSSFPNPLHWFPEFLELGQRRFRRQGRLFGAAILVGVVAGMGAIVFSLACAVVVHLALHGLVGYQAVAPRGEPEFAFLTSAAAGWFHPWLLLLVPAVGGLLSGWLVFTLAPEAEGHGTDAAIAAYHNHQGKIRPRVPLIKLLASAITIGTGGSGGREGPIAQIGAGFGSMLATFFNMTARERRVLLAAGMGAGVSAIFHAPFAGALFAAEVLYRSPEFEPEVILPAGVASVVAYCTFGSVFGWAPLFDIPRLQFDNPFHLGPYLLLAVAMAILAMIYTRSFYGIGGLFHRLPIPRWLKPAIGGCLTGAVALGLYYLLNQQKEALSVLSFGYGILQEGMADETRMSAVILLAVALGKIVTTSLTIGSGGSGGVFGPAMVIGGCGGGALGVFLHSLWPDLAPHPEAFMILGMAGFFAAAAKTPFSTLVIVSEMTANYQMLLPAIWVCTLAYLLSDEQSLYRSQVASRSLSPAHQGSYVREVLAGLLVRQFLKPGVEVPVLGPQDTLATVLDRLDESAYPVLPVVDADRRLLGIVNLEEVHLAAQSPDIKPWVLVEDLMRTKVAPLRPEYRLDRALELFVENDLLALPVVEDGKRVIGLVRRFDIAQTYLRHVHGQREEGEGGYAI